MKYRYALPLFVAAFLLQSTVMTHFTVFGKGPNLLLCLVILLPFLYDGYQGIVLGVLFGLLTDVCSSVIVGPTAVGFLIVAILMSAVRKRLYWDSILSIFVAALVGTCLFYLVLWRITATLGGTYTILFMLKALPVLIVYDFAAMLIFYFVIGRRAIRHPQDKSMKGGLIRFE